MVNASFGSLPFKDQIEFFQQKLNLPSRAWTDIINEQHDHAFVVAGATKKELLTDLRSAIDKAISNGTTLQAFRKDFDKIIAKTGWAYNGGRNWRTRIIYETNLRQSYNAGRVAQMKRIAKTRPYWRYRHNDSVEHPRPEHQAWDGIVLKHDDPWWNTHTPQNGWGCQCFIETLSERDLKKLGKTGPDKAPPLEQQEMTIGEHGPSPRTVTVPKGIDPGFAHQPGRSWIESLTPRPIDHIAKPITPTIATDSLPTIRTAPAARVLSESLADDQYIDKFLKEFGVNTGDRKTVFIDVANEALLISDALFRDRHHQIKINKRNRGRYLLLFADTIKQPDEIWEDWAEINNKTVLRRRYIARWQIKGQQHIPALAVFETGPQGWAGVTAFDPADINKLSNQIRSGVRVYQRDD